MSDRTAHTASIGSRLPEPRGLPRSDAVRRISSGARAAERRRAPADDATSTPSPVMAPQLTRIVLGGLVTVTAACRAAAPARRTHPLAEVRMGLELCRRRPGLARRALLPLLGCALAAAPARAQSPPRSAADSAARAVQAFYAWYVPQARADGAGATWMTAVRARPALFAPALVEALRRDSVASARSRDEVVGLDGDPFLDSQEPCARYVAGRAVARGARVLVDVTGEGGDCAPRTRPDVVVEVARTRGGWRFENFRYPEPPDDLLALLRRLHPGPPRASGRPGG